MKIIIRDRLSRPTVADRLFILHVPDRESRIIVDALNAHAQAFDQYECVMDGYKLYIPRESTKEYFLALSDIWRRWFASRRGGEPYSIHKRDEDIAWLQKNWTKATPTVTHRPNTEKTSLKIKLKLSI